jgi:hypothetical protein
MSEKHDRIDDLTPFESALAGLLPRMEEFNRDRLLFAAGQAAAARDLQAGVPPALSPAEHKRPPRWRSWGWPAAFSAMTGVAAALLVALCMQRSIPTKAIIADQPTNTSPDATTTASGKNPLPLASGNHDLPEAPVQGLPGWLTPWLAVLPGESFAKPADRTFAGSDPELRAELQRRGIDESMHESTGSGSTILARGPLTYYELLYRLEGKTPTSISAPRGSRFE